MKKGIDTLKSFAKVAVDTSMNIAEKGKQLVDIYALEDMLKKAQQQLGILAYQKHKNGSENPELFTKLVYRIELLEKQLRAHGKDVFEKEKVKSYNFESEEAENDAMFCDDGNEELP